MNIVNGDNFAYIKLVPCFPSNFSFSFVFIIMSVKPTTSVQHKNPKWLSPASLDQAGLKRLHLSKSTGNLHGLKCADYSDFYWPLNSMFGEEKYAYALVDIDDPRWDELSTRFEIVKRVFLHYEF